MSTSKTKTNRRLRASLDCAQLHAKTAARVLHDFTRVRKVRAYPQVTQNGGIPRVACHCGYFQNVQILLLQDFKMSAMYTHASLLFALICVLVSVVLVKRKMYNLTQVSLVCYFWTTGSKWSKMGLFRLTGTLFT